MEQKKRSLLKEFSNNRPCLQGQMHLITHTLHPSVIRGLQEEQLGLPICRNRKKSEDTHLSIEEMGQEKGK